MLHRTLIRVGVRVRVRVRVRVWMLHCTLIHAGLLVLHVMIHDGTTCTSHDTSHDT